MTLAVITLQDRDFVIAAEGGALVWAAVAQAKQSVSAAQQAAQESAESAADSAISASVAESAAGPTFSDTASGLAATTDGEAFAVDNGDGTVTVWLNDGGVAVEQRTLATTAALASPTGADRVGYGNRTIGDRLGDWVSVKDFGAKGDGTTDDTAAIQAAFDSDGLAAIFFPAGTYRITGSGAAALTLTKNRNLIGCNRASTLQGASLPATTALLKIAFSDNGGFLDVRGWSMEGLTINPVTGKYAIDISSGFQILSSQIVNCQFGTSSAPDGYSIYIKDNWAHSKIDSSRFATAYMGCMDANVISKCLTFGAGIAVTFDCINGVRNNTVKDCTLVNRDGQLKILNGDNIRFENNQCELAQGIVPPTNQSNPAAMVHIVGVDRPVVNTVITKNNFGGGTSLDYSVYVDNAIKTVIEGDNQFIAVNIADVHFTANSRYHSFGAGNVSVAQPLNPRTDSAFKVKVTDSGRAGIGIRKAGALLNPQAGWSGADFLKTTDGFVNFIGEFRGGSVSPGAILGILPEGFRPYFQKDAVRRNLLTYSEQFSNAAWTKTLASVVSAGKALSGTISLSSISAQDNTGMHKITGIVAGIEDATAYAFSCYLKKFDAGSTGIVMVEIYDPATLGKWVRARVDLSAGTVTTTSNGTFFEAVSGSVESIGGGLYRLKLYATTRTSAAGEYRMGLTPADVGGVNITYTANATVNRVIMSGFQFEKAATASAYQRVVGPTDFETIVISKPFVAVTDLGLGTVNISRQGLITALDLPGNEAVTIAPYRASEMDEVT